VIVEVNIWRYVRAEILLKLSIGDLISLLELAIILSVLLDGVIGQMGEQILRVLNAVFAGSRPDVPVRVPVALHLAVVAGHRHVMPDIKFTPLVEQRALDVLLDDKSTGSSVRVALL
jgi:hypothetical protein